MLESDRTSDNPNQPKRWGVHLFPNIPFRSDYNSQIAPTSWRVDSLKRAGPWPWIQHSRVTQPAPNLISLFCWRGVKLSCSIEVYPPRNAIHSKGMLPSSLFFSKLRSTHVSISSFFASSILFPSSVSASQNKEKWMTNSVLPVITFWNHLLWMSFLICSNRTQMQGTMWSHMGNV